MILQAVGNHLWQSTVFAALVGLATLAFRKNGAAVRHALWLAASVKFLVPFAALIAVGPLAGLRPPAPLVQRDVPIIVDAVSQPFAHLDVQPAAGAPAGTWDGLETTVSVIAGLIWVAGSVLVLAAWWVRWRRVAAITRRAAAIESGREVDALRSIERKAGITRPIALVASDASLEPGIFGIVRPVLVWPRTIASHLDQDQIVTILTHEVSHVRRRDNLAAAAHMIVEALFWFHPLVWWIGARLIDERERACDEDVLGSGHAPEVYAETILTSCRVCVESPLPCVAGVTGPDLKKRIERIMRHGAAERVTAWKKGLLVALAIGSVGTPILLGAASAPRPHIDATIISARLLLPAQQAPPQFEVASVKPNSSGVMKEMIETQPGGRFTATNVTLRQLIRNAYRLQDFQITGGPAWLASDRFDIVAKAEGGNLDDPFQAEKRGGATRAQMMLRALLTERFKLEVHAESKELPIYTLALARTDGTLGPQLRASSRNCDASEIDRAEHAGPAARPALPTEPPPCGMRTLPGTILAGGVRLGQFASTLSALLGRVVQDRTGLSGDFELTLRWTPDQIPQGFDRKASAMGLTPIDPDGPSLPTALREQLGLKLDSQKGPVEIIVIDRAERPTPN